MRVGTCVLVALFSALGTHCSAVLFAPATKWQLHEVVARCLGGCLEWSQSGTNESKCLEWNVDQNNTDGAACQMLLRADVSRIKSFSDLFAGAAYFNEDLSDWDCSSATQMTRMFSGTIRFRQTLCSPNWRRVQKDRSVEKVDMFANSPGEIFCCSRGEKFDQRMRQCRGCEPGYYQDEISTRSACKACNAGKFSSFEVGHTSADQCLPCGAGRYSDEGPGQYQKVESAADYEEVCKPCVAGRYSLAGEVQTAVEVCQACEAGKYQDTPSQVNCKDCVGGRYSDEGEAQVSETTCKKCKTSTWMVPAAGEGNNDSSACRACKFGRYSGPGLLAEDCNFDYFVVLGPVLFLIFCMLAFVGGRVFKRKVWDVAFGKHDDDAAANSRSSRKSVRRHTVRPSPRRTAALMKQTKKMKEKKPRAVVVRPETTFEERFVGHVI